MMTDQLLHNNVNNLSLNNSLEQPMENDTSNGSSDSSSVNVSTFLPGSTNGSLTNHLRSLTLFSSLNDDIKLKIISYVADAPFEQSPDCSRKSSMLTCILPQVCHEFYKFANMDILWKNAIERSLTNEPILWNHALSTLCENSLQSFSSSIYPKVTSQWSSDRHDNENDDIDDEVVHAMIRSILGIRRLPDFSIENISEVLEDAYKSIQYSTVKDLFIKVINTQFRFIGPIYEKYLYINIDVPYTLYINEQRYCSMIKEILKHHPIEQSREGQRIDTDAVFIHANRLPSTIVKSNTAVLVKITRCLALTNDTYEIDVVPFHHVWIERAWEVPNTFCLLHGQALKMGYKQSNLMDNLIEQEMVNYSMEQFLLAVNELPSDSENTTTNEFDTTGINDDDDDDENEDDDDNWFDSNQHSADSPIDDDDNGREVDAEQNSASSSICRSTSCNASDESSGENNYSLLYSIKSNIAEESIDTTSNTSECDPSEDGADEEYCARFSTDYYDGATFSDDEKNKTIDEFVYRYPSDLAQGSRESESYALDSDENVKYVNTDDDDKASFVDECGNSIGALNTDHDEIDTNADIDEYNIGYNDVDCASTGDNISDIDHYNIDYNDVDHGNNSSSYDVYNDNDNDNDNNYDDDDDSYDDYD